MARAKKSSGKAKTVDEYLANLDASSREHVEQLRAIIKRIVPADALEVISYGIPAFRTNRVLVWYAGFSKHCSLFPGAAIIARFRDDLKGYTVSKGTVQFPLDRKLPSALIKALVKARVAEATSTSRRK